MTDETPEVDFAQREMTANWAKITYGTDVWFPMPAEFGGTPWADADEWAIRCIANRFGQDGGAPTRHEVKKFIRPRADALIELQHKIICSPFAHKWYLHYPHFHTMPVVVSVALWKCKGTREQAFAHYGTWGSETATTAPAATPCATEHLGDGIRVRWSGKDGNGTYENVNYVWRDEEFDTDVLVWMTEPESTRFDEVLTDLDEFVKGIYCTPRPHKR